MARRQEGKRILLNTAYALNLIAWIFLLIAFVTPYWVQTWPRIYSGFKRTGLWETCFAGMVLQRDPIMKSFHGCWWILAPEFWHIREWLMPWWFVITQVFSTFCVVIEFISLILILMVWCKTAATSSTGGKRRAPIRTVQAITYITIACAFSKFAMSLIFGIAVYIDHLWMPTGHLAYLSWSYGLFVLSAFFSVFSSFPLVKYKNIVKSEYRDPGMMAPAMPFKDSVI